MSLQAGTVASIEQWTWVEPRPGLTLGQLLDRLIEQEITVQAVDQNNNRLQVSHTREDH